MSFDAVFFLSLRLRPPDKSAIVELFFYFSSKTYVVGTQKNRLNETVLLSTQNPGKKILTYLFYANKMYLSGSMELLNMVFTLTQKE